ncbi:hypothetical protein [Amnibacterium endophyticum]|uniref:Uncharacterized protein n=1 Tax=Amnibacterium endophyticum TaxID=2109337 RepID=A0ABW4LLD4_9MICO
MTDVTGRRGERLWEGFTPEGALAWSRVLRMHWPSFPGMSTLWAISIGLDEGVPAGVDAWVERARVAEAVGFSPGSYDRLQRTLDEIPAVELPAHPDNAPDPRWPAHAIRGFEPALWSDWPLLVGLGWSDEEAVRLLLTARDVLG